MHPADIHLLADLAAEKIRGGYNAPHALNSALKDVGVAEREREMMRREVAQELNRRSRLRRGKRKRAGQETAARLQRAHQAITKEECLREARRMAYERRDHLLADL